MGRLTAVPRERHPPVAHCPAHHKYTGGCTACQAVRRAYKAGPGGDGTRRHQAAVMAAYRRLAKAHPGEYRRYLTEETAARAPRRTEEKPAP